MEMIKVPTTVGMGGKDAIGSKCRVLSTVYESVSIQ